MKRANRRKALFWLIAAIFVVFLFWCLVGITITPSPQTPLEKLEQARSLWNKQKIISYRMTVSFFRSFGFVGRFNFSIENNKVVKIENVDSSPRNSPSLDSFQPAWYTADSGYAKFFPKSLDKYTVNQLFDFAADKLRDEPAPPVIAWCSETANDPERFHYEVKFDQQRGNISFLHFTDCPRMPEWGGGLLCPVSSDCSNGFAISELNPFP